METPPIFSTKEIESVLNKMLAKYINQSINLTSVLSETIELTFQHLAKEVESVIEECSSFSSVDNRKFISARDIEELKSRLFGEGGEEK